MEDRRFSNHLLRVLMFVIVFGMIIIGIITNFTLRSIEKNLPNDLLSELNDLSAVLEALAEVVATAEKARIQTNAETISLLKKKVDSIYQEVIDLRESYVFDNMVKASAFHAVVAPAIADLRIWLSEGVSGFGPKTEQTAAIARMRIQGAYHKSRILIRDSRAAAQIILDNQKERLDRFLLNVNLLFAFAILITCGMIYLIYRQQVLQRREALAQKDLRYQRDLLNTLFENVMLGITVWSREGDLLLANPTFSDITGYSAKEIKSLNNWFPKAYPDPQYRNRVMEDWQRSSRQPRPICEYKVTCKNGQIKDIEFRESFLPDSRSLVTLSDITEKKKSEKLILENREIKARAKKMESLGLLAGGVAHDLNNILSGIVSYPELILMDLPKENPLVQPIQKIQEAGKRAAAIVMDLLTVARGVATTKEPMNLNPVVRDYIGSPEFAVLTQCHPDLRIEVKLEKDLFNIHGSWIHVRKAIMNLIANAAEAIDADGLITISTFNRYVDTPLRGYGHIEEGEYAVLSISDNGTGISKDDLERIFEPFYTKKMMGRSGTGLGLAVVWNIVQDHFGYINVDTEANHTTFLLFFPVTRALISEPRKDRAVEEFSGNGETILVVDDISIQREIVSEMLEKLKYSPIAVSSGEEAVDFLSQGEADLVVLDMIMDPGINGRETYERILKIKPGQSAVITSGFAETEEVRKAQEMGAGRYIRKPFSLETLGLAIKDALEVKTA